MTPPPTPVTTEWLTADEATAYLRFPSRDALYQAVHRGQLPAHRLGWLTSKALRGWMKSAQRLAGLKVTGNFHILRHTFCSHLAMRGAVPKVIQELAGHAQLSTTMRYMHLASGHKEEAIRLLERRPGSAAATVEAGLEAL